MNDDPSAAPDWEDWAATCRLLDQVSTVTLLQTEAIGELRAELALVRGQAQLLETVLFSLVTAGIITSEG
jgi:hypothetical protein